jgi:hypothetical protein
MYYANGHNSLQDGAWHHFAVVVDGVDNTFYVDGEKVATSFQAGNATTSYFTNLAVTKGDTYRLGAFYQGGGSSDFATAEITDLVVWDTGLSATDVSELYSKIKGMARQIKPANILDHRPLNDGPDGTSADGDNIRDLSVNRNTGTGDDGANNTGLTWQAESVLTHP